MRCGQKRKKKNREREKRKEGKEGGSKAWRRGERGRNKGQARQLRREPHAALWKEKRKRTSFSLF